MFTGFDLKTTKTFRDYRADAQRIFRDHKAKTKQELDKFLLGDASLDGTAMQNNWFPEIEANIFISHSHTDEDLAKGLAGFLYRRFGLVSFIDSCVWGYADDLLQKIDDDYCLNEKKGVYNYGKRNYSTSHVHMMLATALTMMIDKAECIIFINSPESISTSDTIENRTRSPWIYHEIGMTQLVRRRSRVEHRPKVRKGSKVLE